MKRFMGVFLCGIFLFSAYVHAHPGKTDYRGGHKCWKNCSEWDLSYGEYHLHDKDWKPRRVDREGKPINPIQYNPIIEPELIGQTQVVATTEEKIYEVKKPATKTIVEHDYNVMIHEESIIPFSSIPLFILAVLLLIALIFIRGKREKTKT